MIIIRIIISQTNLVFIYTYFKNLFYQRFFFQILYDLNLLQNNKNSMIDAIFNKSVAQNLSKLSQKCNHQIFILKPVL